MAPTDFSVQMLTTVQDSSVLLAFAAALPAILSWWWGRRLPALVDDPILPERLVAHQRRNGVAAGLAIAAVAVISPRSLMWTVPLTIVALYAAAFPLRKALFAETWTLVAYLSFFGRLFAGLFGFWMLLAATPSLVALTGTADWAVAIGIAGLLLAWNSRYADIVRLSLRAGPLEDGPLLARCRALAEACGLPQPRFERIDLHGGVVANALALPALRGSSVLFTDTLLARLRDDEAAAICAHELAHLEYYHPRRLQRLHGVTLALIVTGAAWTPVLRFAGFAASGWTTAIWLLALAAALFARARDKQRQETVCDARAVGLVGAESLVTALTKLYTIARIPRRIELQQDQSGTHPSLARRIRDIRKAAGTAPASLAAATSFTSADGQTTATFGAGTLQWVGGDAITQTVDYAHLAELRIDARRAAAPRLVVRGQTRRWEMGLNAADVARVQAVLDIVDSRLGEMPAAPAVPFKFSRPLIAIVTLMAFTLGQIAVAVVAVLACIRLAPPLLVAAGLAAITAAALAVRDAPSGFALVSAMPMAVAGIALMLLAWSNRNEKHSSIRPMLAIMGVLALSAVASITVTGIDVVRLHQSARMTPSAIVWLVALTGALACAQTRRGQLAGLGTVTVAALTGLVGSSLFLDRLGDDPFLVDSPAIRWVAVRHPATSEFELPAFTATLHLSPDGKYVAALDQRDTDDDATSRFHVGRTGETLTALAADDVLFVDNQHLLVAAADQRGTTIQKVKLSGSLQVVWQQRVDDLLAPSIAVDRAAQTWRLTGWTSDHGMARAEGVIGAAHVDEARWPADMTSEAVIDAFTSRGRDALVVESRFDAGVFDRVSPRWRMMLLLMQRYSQESRYWKLGPAGRTELGASRLGADCHAGLLPADALACVTFDGTRTRIFKLEMTGRIEGLGWLDGRFSSDQNDVPGWLSGWAESTPAAIRLSTREAYTLGERRGISHLTAAGDRLAAVTYDGHGAKVLTYDLDRTDGRRTAGRR